MASGGFSLGAKAQKIFQKIAEKPKNDISLPDDEDSDYDLSNDVYDFSDSSSSDDTSSSDFLDEDLLDEEYYGPDLATMTGDERAYLLEKIHTTYTKANMHRGLNAGCEAYSNWLKKKESDLTEKQMKLHTDYSQILKKMRDTFESEQADDSEENKMKNSEDVYSLRRETLKKYGMPPKPVYSSMAFFDDNDLNDLCEIS